MTDTTITFSFLDHSGTERQGAWTGRKAEAIERAASHLRATWLTDSDCYVYTADEAGGDFIVSPSEMAKLGAGLIMKSRLVVVNDVYSLWCSQHGQEA
jgi:hypothetical protein